MKNKFKKVLVRFCFCISILLIPQALFGEIPSDLYAIRVEDTSIMQQNEGKRITGRVTEANGDPLIGVSVIEEGTTNGSITDIDGIFVLNVKERSKVVFSFVGFKSQTLVVGSTNIYDVTLMEDVSELEELVVTGYGQQRKISSVGAQETMSVKDVKVPTGSISNVISGRIAGVIGVQRSGEPGRDAADLWIRGITTPNGSSPLVLVDGVERPFNDIDPEDIESISLLKDASATAVYGVRGANGVLVIKTKGGTIGKPTVSVDYYEGFNKFTKMPKLANGETYMNAANEAARNIGENTPYTADYIEKTVSGYDPLLYPNVNWRKEIFNDWAHSRRVNANIRGGSNMAQFYASVSYYNETGMVKTNGYENYDSQINFDRYNFTTNINLDITSTTKVDIGVQGYFGKGTYGGESVHTVFSSTQSINPVMMPKMFVINGKQYVPGRHMAGGDRNPYADATMGGYTKDERNKIQSNLRLTQQLDFLTKGLSFSAMFAFDVNNVRSRDYRKRDSTYDFADRNNPYDESGYPILSVMWRNEDPGLNFSKSSSGDTKDYFETSLNYERVFNNDHRVGGMFIYTQQSRVDNEAGDIVGAIPYRMQGVAGRATYSWRDRYLAEFNIGYNGGENFPKKKRFGTFPAFGIGWVVSNESFWEPLQDIVSFFKIRYTNGKVGNSNVGGRRFMYIPQMHGTDDYGYSFGTNYKSGYAIDNPATSLGWEVAHKQDLGFDLHMLNDDLRIVVDLFKENRKDILLHRDQSLPGYAGFQALPYGNVGETRTYGMEVSVDYFKRLNKDLALTLRGNFTWADPEWIDNDVPHREESWRNQKGFSLTSIEGYTAIGLYSQSDIDLINAWYSLPEDIRNETKQPFPTPPNCGLHQVQAGDIMYLDRNGDGAIRDIDKSWLGNGDVPEINYGFGFNLDYKDFTLGVLFQGTAKANRFVNGILYPFNDSGSANVYSNIDDRWSPENPSANVFYPRLAYKSDAIGNQNNHLPSTWWLKDMSFLRLKTLQLAYNIPDNFCHKLGLSNASIYLMGMNLFYFSKWKLWDPELNTSDGSMYPNTTSVSVGLNLTF